MIRRYVHLGTGNYHPKTARLYTDLSFFSCDEDLGEEVAQLFNFLTGYSRYDDWKRLLVAPRTLRPRLLELIRHEIEAARAGKKARIVAKMNSLEDPEVILHLYEASQAGVTIDLVVRGFCCLHPGVEGLSENIRVFSVLGQFLEHSRIYYFWAGGSERIFMGSADWMPRNLDRRVESLVEIQDRELKERMMLEGLEASLADNVKGRQLLPDGSYRRRVPGKAAPFDSQEAVTVFRFPRGMDELALTRGDAPIAIELAAPPEESVKDRKRKRRRVKQEAKAGHSPRAS
jgi:polyphosphate kinase